MSNGVQMEHDDHGWTFRFEDPDVTQVCLDQRVSFLLGGGASIMIAGDFELRTRLSTLRLDSELVTPELGHVVALLRSRVEKLRVELAGQLRVDFAEGVVIEVPVSPDYESWELLLPDGALWIGMPGGGEPTRFPAR